MRIKFDVPRNEDAALGLAVRRERRMVGTVVVPGKHITRIEISELHFQ